MMIECIRTQESVNCFLCGTEGLLLYQKMRDKLFDAPGVWAFLRCPRCGLVWLNPRPIPEDIWKIYNIYHTHLAKDGKPRLASLRKRIKYATLASSFGYEGLVSKGSSKWIGTVLGLFPPLRELVGFSIRWLNGSHKGKLLDLGCGKGSFLATMRDLGWDILGVEIDAQAASVAQDHFGVPVVKSPLEKAKFPADSFDAVTITHVLEHVHDPIGLLKECLRVLKPGGRLVVVTPNAESLGHRIFKRSWRGLEPPRHLCLFSMQTLRICTERVGAQVKILRTSARSACFIWKASNLIRRENELPVSSPPRLNLSLRFGGMAFQLLEHGLQSFQRNIGEELILIASNE